MTTVVLSNAKEIKESIAQKTSLVVPAIRLEFKKIGRDVMRQAKATHRFKNQSGHLESSIGYRTEDKGLSLVCYAGADPALQYAKSVHNGHGTWGRDPFLEVAFQSIDMGSRLDTAIKKVLHA